MIHPREKRKRRRERRWRICEGPGVFDRPRRGKVKCRKEGARRHLEKESRSDNSILVIDVGVHHALVVFIYVKVCISRRRSQFYDNIKCLVLLSAGSG